MLSMLHSLWKSWTREALRVLETEFRDDRSKIRIFHYEPHVSRSKMRVENSPRKPAEKNIE